MTTTAAPAQVQRSTLWASLAAAGAGGVLAITAAIFDQPLLLLAGASTVAIALVVLAAIHDARTGLLPNRLLAPAGALLAIALPLHALLTGDPARLGQGLLGAGIVAALYMAVYAAGGTSAGDVKLATIIGLHTAYLSWMGGAIALATPYLLAVPVVIYFAARGQAKRRIPFGPFLAAGYGVALASTALSAWAL